MADVALVLERVRETGNGDMRTYGCSHVYPYTPLRFVHTYMCTGGEQQIFSAFLWIEMRMVTNMDSKV